MKKIFTVLFILQAFLGCTQGKYNIVKTYGYYKEFVPGAMPVDDNGRQLSRNSDTVFLAFLETKKAVLPIWQRAWVNNKTYQVLTTKMGTAHRVGFKNDSDDTVTLRVNNKSQLIQLNLERSVVAALPLAYREKMKKNSILLEGVFNNKKVYMVIPPAAHLRADEYY